MTYTQKLLASWKYKLLDALVLVVVIPHPHRPDVTSTTFRYGIRDADLCQISGTHSDAAKVSGLLGYDAVSVVSVVLDFRESHTNVIPLKT